jgi:glycosyltransferase involved in cell wall biosynthesis
MTILIISQYFFPEHFEINAVARALSLHHRVIVLTGMPNYPSGRFYDGYGGIRARVEVVEGIEILRAPLLARGSGSGVRLALNYLSFAMTACLLVPKLRKRGIETILVYQPSPFTVALPALVAKWLTGAPIWFWVQDLWPETLVATGAIRHAWVFALLRKIVRAVYRRTEVILVASRAFVAPIRALDPSLPDIRYLPNGADDVAPAKCSRSKGHGLRVAYGGNIGSAQDFDILLKAAATLRDHDIEWLIMGDGRQRAALEQQIRRRGLETCVHLLPWRSAAQASELFASADVLFLSLRSARVFELTVPSKLQAYLAAARPIIGCLQGEPARIIVDAGAGLVCPPGDDAALVEAVLTLLNMPPEERDPMGVAGRRYFEHEFARDIVSRRLNDWLMERRSR